MDTHEFRTRIRKSLANENLQIALDANTERRLTGRLAAFESLPDWQARRQQAHAVRAAVIENLDGYLNEFIRNATRNGIAVHRARDAAEAVSVFCSLLGPAPQAKLVAKSKSMVSEEIDLNPALEAQGLRVVETDLGEYIVQLRHERPAHIITPAVHLRRADVGRLFHEQLDIPYTEDIPTLTGTARRVLREVFLTADVGVSGVNFAIAETGGFCLVTNEGNGRMVTTLPPIHIALMGMERLVPTLADLALMLSLLARSATTQKLSVYTQLIHQPLPGQQRHIIVLDNGRSQLRGSPLRESLYCIRCGACLNACPVFRELGGHAYQSVYGGPIGSVISAGLFGSEFVPLAQASSLCGACREACPVDIDLPKLLTRVRAGQSPGPTTVRQPQAAEGGGLSTKSRLFLRAYGWLATRPAFFAGAQKLAGLGTRLLAPRQAQLQLPAWTGWGYSKDLPRFAGRTFRERWRAGLPVEPEPGPRSADPPVEEQVDAVSRPAARLPERVEQFIHELAKVNGSVIRTTHLELTARVIDLLRARDIDCLHVQPEVLDEEELTAAGLTLRHAANPATRAGLTRALCGLADTGSILEADGPGDKLKASLLPEIHLAVLQRSAIYGTLAEALHLVPGTRAAVFITGPSRTADIEMTLTIGVHGPKELHVFLVDD